MDEQVRKAIEGGLSGVICDRCGATLATYHEACPVPFTGPCPGLHRIEHAVAAAKACGARPH
ncbi:MAG TPA: hypothetical protein VGE72_24090 [Azospirillum sp.]